MLPLDLCVALIRHVHVLRCMTVNYKYTLEDIVENNVTYMGEQKVVATPELDALADLAI